MLCLDNDDISRRGRSFPAGFKYFGTYKLDTPKTLLQATRKGEALY